jgi:hypothetical protein
MSNEQAIAESTTKVYLSNIGVIARSMGFKDVPTTGDWLQNSEQIIEHLSRIKNLNTRKNKLMTIIVFAKAYDLPAAVVDAYSKEADKLSGQLQAFLSKNEKSERQRSNWMTKEELQTFAATLKADIPPKIKSFEDYERVMRYVLVQFHLSHPIRNDLADAKVYLQADKPAQEPTTNYILLNKSRKSAVLVLNNYKTFKFYGKKTIDVEPALAALLIKYYAVIKEYSPERWLLVRKRSKAGAYEKATRNDYTKFLLQTFKRTGKRVSSTMIRHSIVSDAYNISHLKQLAEEMGHSVGTAMGVYAKEE